MSSVGVTEGEAPFDLPAAGKPCNTWYKVLGTLGTRRPLIALHGGPGVPHGYLVNLADLAEVYGIPVVLYDQLGTGNSTHLSGKEGDKEFWTEELFLRQLESLLAHLGVQDEYDLIGHSWGGMLAARHASRRPPGLKKLILWSTSAAVKLWYEAQSLLRSQLPQNIQEAIITAEKVESSPERTAAYGNAVQVYYSHFACRIQPMPTVLLEALAVAGSDRSAHDTLLGPFTFKIVGSMRNWSMVEDAHKIDVPTLLLNGKYDQAQDSTMEPYSLSIPNVKWVKFEESSHMAHFEERERFMEVVGEFLSS